MSDDYRDPLAAALSRIDTLERENAALKNMQSGRPATVAELEAVRLENELYRVDAQWSDAMKARYGRPITGTEKTVDRAEIRRRRRMWVVAGVALAFPLIAFVLGGGPLGIALGGIAVTGAAIVALVYFLQAMTAPGIARERARLAKARDPIVKRLAELRGEPLLEEEEVPAPVRVSASDAAPALETEVSAGEEGAGAGAATARRS